MKTIKLLMTLAAICSTLAALLLLWTEKSTTCDVFTLKLMESMFIIVAILATKEAVKAE